MENIKMKKEITIAEFADELKKRLENGQTVDCCKEEFIVIVSGVVEVIYGNETYELKPGDSIYYNSVVPHYVSCVGEEKAEIYAVVYIPE